MSEVRAFKGIWIDKRNYHAFEIGVSERPDMIVTKE